MVSLIECITIPSLAAWWPGRAVAPGLPISDHAIDRHEAATAFRQSSAITAPMPGNHMRSTDAGRQTVDKALPDGVLDRLGVPPGGANSRM
jgi:hypothetical protein